MTTTVPHPPERPDAPTIRADGHESQRFSNSSWPPPEPTTRVLHRRDRLLRGLFVAIALAIVATALAFDRSAIGAIAALFVLVVPFEKAFPRHRGQRLRRPQVATDVGYALAGPVLNVVGVAVAVVVGIITFAWLPGLAIRPLVGMLPPAALPFVGIALFDLAIYWVHRWSHEVPLLWRFHAIHHSTETLDWVSGFRSHPVDGAIVAPPFFFLLAAGFDAEFSGLLAVVQIIAGLFLHANVRWRLRPLHRIIITPEFHHWHHTNDPQAIHSNYSVFLPLWDLVFGTYFMPEDRRPEVYGVDEYIPVGMIPQLLHPFRGMGNPIDRLRHPILTVRSLGRLGMTIARGVRRSTFRPRRPTAH